MISIAKWNETFETAKTRKLKHLQWIHFPTGNDSAGYVSLMSLGEPGVTAFGVFVAICQWSATRPPVIRHSLARTDGKPISMQQLALLIRMPTDVVIRSIEILSSQDVGWLVHDETKKTSEFE